MPQPRVLILGAGRLNLPTLRAIRAAGFHAIAADGNPSAPGFAAADTRVTADIRDAAAILNVAREHAPVDGIVSLAEVGVRPAASACSVLGLPSIGEEAARKATSKVEMRRSWDAIPEHSVPWRLVHDEQEALAAVDAVGGFPVVVKPDRTYGGSRGVSRAGDRAQLIEAYAFARGAGFTEDVIVEQFIESIAEHSAEVLIDGDEVSVLCIGEKIKTRAPWRVDLSVRYPSPIDEERVRAMCARAVRALGLTRGAAHVEFGWTADGPRLLELGARSGGGHTPMLARHVSGVDEIAEICRMACGLPPRTMRATQRRGGEYRFLAFPPGVFEEAIIPDDVKRDPKICDAGVMLARGAALSEVRTGADRPGFIAAFGDDRDDAVAAADRAAERIAVRYADGRVERAIDMAEAGEVRCQG